MSDAIHLPHTGRARMIVAAERTPSGDARCSASVPSDHPLVRNGRVASSVLMELGAQAAATLAAAAESDELAGPGRVVAVKELHWDAASVPAGVELSVRVSLLEAAESLRNYAFEIEGLGRGVVSVWLG